MNSCECISPGHIIFTEFSELDEFIRTVALSNPSQIVHVVFASSDMVFIYYGNSRELLFCRTGIESNIYEVDVENGFKVQPIEPMDITGSPSKRYVYFSKVASSTLLSYIKNYRR